MKKTALYETHKKSGGKIVDFAGWQMPVEFRGVIKEHMAVRCKAGIFDVSHMGEIEVMGKEAADFCQWVATNDIKKLNVGNAQYTLLCNENGGVVDDIVVYKFCEDHYLICANASNTEKDFDWLCSKSGDFDVQIKNSSDKFSQFAVQGPNAVGILNKFFDSDLNLISRFSFGKLKFEDAEVIAARTGYTGEDGFELFFPSEKAENLWNGILNIGRDFGLELCGLGARDTLRIEMGYSLYGHEIDDDISPLEAGLKRYVKLKKGEFIAKDVLIKQCENGCGRKIIGFEMTERGIPRQGYKIFKNNNQIGIVTSGTLSPSLKKGVGIGLIDINEDILTDIEIEIRRQMKKASISNFPFYRH
ncbi:MAG: glycine cleavage system aminomethyltransferase GcvT [Thermodesulfobacteriota bacterium]